MDKIILANPRGFCAGVNRAIDTLDLVLEKFMRPVYAYHEIVHNKHVVQRFAKKGVIFVDDIDEVPDENNIVFSAHGVSPAIRKRAIEKKLRVIDTTCPLVNKTHIEAINYSNKGYKIVLIGKKGHQEVVGIMGEAPMVLIGNVDEVDGLGIKESDKAVCLTQTTLSIDETADIVNQLKEKYCNMEFPMKENICYATQNRQNAVKKLATLSDYVVIIGSSNSSNSNKLREVASKITSAVLVENENEMGGIDFSGTSTLGISSGASAPEELVLGVVERLKEMNPGVIIEKLVDTEEAMRFPLPIQM